MVVAEEVQVGDWSGAGYIVMDDSGAAGYMISGGIAGGSSSIKADLAFLANLGFGIADVVESVKLISLGIKALAISRILGVITIIVGLVFLGLALYSLWNTISLYKDYKNGDYEAGQELIEDLLWNIGLTLATFGLSSLLKYFAKRLALKKLTEIFGENVAKNITKNAEAYDVYRTIKKIRKLGVSDDVIKEFAERMGKDSLDWLENVKKIFNFTDDELRKLVKLGDDLYNYSDDFLEAFKNSNYQDEIIEAVSKYKDDAVDAITRYKDDAARVISKHGKEAVDAISKNIDPDLIEKLDDLGIKPSDYDKLGIVGREAAENIAEAINIAKTSTTVLRNAIKDGSIILKTADGRIFIPQKIAMAVDKTDPGNIMKHTYGFNRVWDSNPSIGDDIIDVVGKNRDEIAELYTKHNLETLYSDSFIDELFTKYPEHFSELGVTKDEIITEMDKFREMLIAAKEKAAKGTIKAPDGSPSFEPDWSIENCAEVWAMRNAILSGVKVENVMLRTIKYNDGSYAELCFNCKETFKSLIESARIIMD